MPSEKSSPKEAEAPRIDWQTARRKLRLQSRIPDGRTPTDSERAILHNDRTATAELGDVYVCTRFSSCQQQLAVAVVYVRTCATWEECGLPPIDLN